MLPVIDAILVADRLAPTKQQHSAKRILERLRDEHSFKGGYPAIAVTPVLLRQCDDVVSQLPLVIRPTRYLTMCRSMLSENTAY